MWRAEALASIEMVVMKSPCSGVNRGIFVHCEIFAGESAEPAARRVTVCRGTADYSTAIMVQAVT